jgi:shikimate kinase
VIAHRIGVDPASVTKRPALTEQSALEEVRTLLAERTPLYEACSSIAIDTNDWIPDDLVEEIVRKCGL